MSSTPVFITTAQLMVLAAQYAINPAKALSQDISFRAAGMDTAEGRQRLLKLAHELDMTHVHVLGCAISPDTVSEIKGFRYIHTFTFELYTFDTDISGLI